MSTQFNHLRVSFDVEADHDVRAGQDVFASRDVISTRDLVSNEDITAVRDVNAGQDVIATRDLSIGRDASITNITTSHFRPKQYATYASLPAAASFEGCVATLTATAPETQFFSDGIIWRPVTPSQWWAILNYNNTSTAVPPSASALAIAKSGGATTYSANTKITSGWTNSASLIASSSFGNFQPNTTDDLNAVYLINVRTECQMYNNSSNSGRVIVNLFDETATTLAATIGQYDYAVSMQSGYQFGFSATYIWQPTNNNVYRLGWYRAADTLNDMMIRSVNVSIVRLT